MKYYIWGQMLLSLLVICDMFRRPQSVWAAADRNRGFWVGILAATSLVGLGPVAWILYGTIVVPHLSGTRDPFPVSEAFRKH